MSNTPKIKARPEGDSPGQALALRHVGEAFSILIDIMRDKAAAPATRLRAACTVIERAWGRVGAKTKAAVQQAVAPGPFVNAPQMDREEWIARFAQPGASAASAAAGPGDAPPLAVWRKG